MKIISLTAENIKRIKAITITPTGDLVEIVGKNGQGKSSVLDSIWWALAGSKHIQEVPIRSGATKARIRLDLGEIVVERKFNASGTTLTVEAQNGARFPNPQTMLDKLIGALSFDPLAFSRMPARQQFDELRRVSKLDVDIDALDAANKGDYAKRTDINRDAKAKRAQAAGIAAPQGEPAALMDESALIESMQQAGETNTRIEALKSTRAQQQAQAQAKKIAAVKSRDSAAKLREQADALEREASTLLNEAAGIEKQLDDAPPLPEAVDVSSLRQQIEKARASNKTAAEHANAITLRTQIIAEAKALEDHSEALTATMEARSKAKSDAISKAALPVPGLGFGDDLVTYNGVPFSQASSAEQLRVSLAIAMAANPQLRVLRVQDGSLLDADSMNAIEAMARDGDYQIWIERVESSGRVGVVIEDGAVAQVEVKDAQ
jgi:DNA repair exonuclease SbcCD ATPase subunit